jgi:hypothetical protein
MKKEFYLIPLVGSFLLISIFGCGSTSSAPSSQSVGADVIQKYSFQVEGLPITTPLTLPQQLTDANWSLKEGLCQQAGYELAPYAGQNVSLTKYNLLERYYYRIITWVQFIGLPSQSVITDVDLSLYLWVIAKDQTTVCSYISVAEDSTAYEDLRQRGLFPEFFAVNDEHIK